MERARTEGLTTKLAVYAFGLAFSAFAQQDGAKFASDLRAKYGAPLARVVFAVPVGEMIVDYATNGHVCRIQLPPVGPINGRPGVSSTKVIDDFTLELLPPVMRGKELRRWSMATGATGAALGVEYENVTISSVLNGATRDNVTITFTKERCPEPLR